jgi:radical SAM protein (TIGR01212 family)
MVVAAQRYRKLNTFLRGVFGEKVYRIGLWAGFTCPNRDGTKGVGGCVFCNPASSEPLGHVPGTPISQQVASGAEYIRGRHGAGKFIAFFSDYTTTYADVKRLEALYRQALGHPGVVGLALSTRPDCLSRELLDLLETIARETFLWVELGVQSAHDRSLELINRCHTVVDSRRAIARLRARDIAVSGHVILGLPGETPEDMLETARFLAETGVHGVKIHNLHVVEGTRLADLYRRGEHVPLALPEYVDLLVRFLEHLPPKVILQRLSGEAPRRLTVAPAWSVNKLAVFNAIERELERRDAWQGKALGHGLEDLQVPISIPGASVTGAAGSGTRTAAPARREPRTRDTRSSTRRHPPWPRPPE